VLRSSPEHRAKHGSPDDAHVDLDERAPRTAGDRGGAGQ
jgi:hypothetical protein